MKKKIVKIVLQATVAALTAVITVLSVTSCTTFLRASDIEYNGSIGNHCNIDSIK